jgi:diacylglycerol kinase (ATP)
MKIAIVLNGISRKKKFFYQKIYPSLAAAFDVVVCETQYPTHARELAREQALRSDVILAAGGDGTLHQVLNGIMDAKRSGEVALGVIPLGTGNDYARTCRIRCDTKQLVSMLKANRPLPTDIGTIGCVDADHRKVSRHFINVCSVGMGPEVVRRLERSSRALGPTLTYLKAIVTTFFTHHPQFMLIETGDWKWQGKIRVMAIALGKSFGNAMYIAPEAKIDDGLFSTFIAGALSMFRFLLCLQQIKKCRRVNHPQIQYDQAKEAVLTSPVLTALEAEGELVGQLPARITMQPGGINFLR